MRCPATYKGEQCGRLIRHEGPHEGYTTHTVWYDPRLKRLGWYVVLGAVAVGFLLGLVVGLALDFLYTK